MQKATMLRIELEAIAEGELHIDDKEGNAIVHATSELLKGFLDDYLQQPFELRVDLTVAHLVEVGGKPQVIH